MTEQGKKYLSDILRAIELIEQFTTHTANYNDYILNYIIFKLSLCRNLDYITLCAIPSGYRHDRKSFHFQAANERFLLPYPYFLQSV